MAAHIVIIGTLDTKGAEVGFVRDLIERRGHHALTVDTGLLGSPAFAATVPREEVAREAGTTIPAILAQKDKNLAIRTMTEGAIRVALRLHGQGRLDAVLALGGGQGTVMGTAVMRALPFGVPKVMVSAVANGRAPFGPFVGHRDIMILHSVADVLGLNMVTRRVLGQAAGAVVGMVETELEPVRSTRPAVGMTTAGVTTACAMRIAEVLERKGYEVIAFHCNGIGARAMEELAGEGRLAGVLDLSPHDIPDALFGGIFPSDPERMRATGRRGVPQVFVPGAADFILFGPVAETPPQMLRRKYVIHNPLHTHVRANREEMAAVGRYVAGRLLESRGPAAVLVPGGGFTQLNIAGGPMYEPESDRGFLEGLREVLLAAGERGAAIGVTELDLHINDPAFAEAAAEAMHALIRGAGRQVKEAST